MSLLPTPVGLNVFNSMYYYINYTTYQAYLSIARATKNALDKKAFSVWTHGESNPALPDVHRDVI